MQAGLQLCAWNNRWAGFCHTRLLRANLGGQHRTVSTKAASTAHALNLSVKKNISALKISVSEAMKKRDF